MGVKARFWAVSAGKAVAGECISFIPDTMEYSESDRNDKYSYIVHFPDLSIEKAPQLKEKQFRPANIGEPEFEAPDEKDRYVQTGKRKWRLKVEDIQSISTNKEHSIRKRDLDPCIENKDKDGDFLKIAKVTRG